MIIGPSHRQAAVGYQPAVTGHSDGADPAATAEEASASPASEEADEGLTPEEQRMVRELAARDREVRAHEQAHLSAAGGLARGGASFVFQRGPDQRNYAVGGEVQIDTGAVADDPHATLRKAEQVLRAALAPAQPSGQDRAVAADAAAMAAEARVQMLRSAMEDDAGNQHGVAESGVDAAAGSAPDADEADSANEDHGADRNETAAAAINAYAQHAEGPAPAPLQTAFTEHA